MNDKQTTPLEKVKRGDITYTEFLKEADCYTQFSDWCRDHHLKEDEGAAQCFFDYFGFEDEEMVKIYIETVA